MSETKHTGPLTRAWYASLMILGIVLVLSFALKILAEIWIFVVAVIVVAIIITVLVWSHRRGGRW
jgi:protein-S-isoprenylcysteine O-methyltransferase Ste14